MNISEMIEAKKNTGLSYDEIAERSGVPVSTVQKVFSGATKNPRYETLCKLYGVFEKDALSNSSPAHAKICEPVSYAHSIEQNTHIYSKQGSYTLEDYYALPDEQRVELIDGVFYDMSAPASIHQMFVGEIYYQIMDFIKRNKGDCVPFISPADVRLDGANDNRTMVQPDVYIVCNKGQIEPLNVVGAPDFVLEVLSPSTRKKDMTKKLQKYMDAGVREYWIIDPDDGRIITYDLEHDCRISIHTIHEKVPVMIYDGKLEIDFPSMPEYILKYYE